MKKNMIFSGLIALVVSLSSIGIFYSTIEGSKTVQIEHINATPSKSAVYTLNKEGKPIPLDFNQTAERVIDGVVHIKSTHLYEGNSQNFQYRNIPDPFRDFFGDQFDQFFGSPFKQQAPRSQQNNEMEKMPTKVGTGSGVIISEDGYIVTNNHVIAEADDIEVTLHDNRTYKAAVVGADPSTDLALLQIKEKNLPTVPFVDSDNVHIGQWVLAVGNPMGLNSTVTAGIVSAKGRSINILKDKYAIENFIQTDAAINPGNSGGALVNFDGGLVGINTAIASPTGSFAGYGFAVPANIVSKVVEDIIEYGVVQRGILGVTIRTVDGNLAKDKDLSLMRGVYVDSLIEKSAAAKAGIKVGDVIIALDDIEVATSSELQGAVARYRPGEEVNVRLNRDGEEMEMAVTLTNREGDIAFTKKDSREIEKVIGADFETVDKELAKELDIKGGVKVNKLYAGKLRKFTQMRDGFIITKVNGKNVKDVDQLLDYLENHEGGVMLEGIYEDIPGEYYYAFGM